ncbi:MAG: adenosylcobinamide-GDP ribazoletransferase, partial [Moorella sp. (in: Bacteria)]|nr:adenosylcobinamide-GDP ribazoletransferase [Moorella sp. (in: firmicutes)]
MKGPLDAFLTALQFLTRIRLSKGGNSPVAFPQSVAFFPLVGLLLGLILAGCWQALPYHVPVTARAGLVLGAAVFLTGGLHLDGFIDTMDGLFSGRERQRILAIMKDSHVGAHGVTAVVTLLVLKYGLLTALPAGSLWLADVPLPPLLVLTMVLSRWSMVLALT